MSVDGGNPAAARVPPARLTASTGSDRVLVLRAGHGYLQRDEQGHRPGHGKIHAVFEQR